MSISFFLQLNSLQEPAGHISWGSLCIPLAVPDSFVQFFSVKEDYRRIIVLKEAGIVVLSLFMLQAKVYSFEFVR